MRLRCLTGLALILAASSADAATAWVSNERDNTISVIDVATLELVDTIRVGQRPRGSLDRHGDRIGKLAVVVKASNGDVQVDGAF